MKCAGANLNFIKINIKNAANVVSTHSDINKGACSLSFDVV